MMDKFIYLFLINLYELSEANPRKPEVEAGWEDLLRAYVAAFKTPKDGSITENLIKLIHKEVARSDRQANPGQYKNKHTHFGIYPYEMNRKMVLGRNLAYS